MKWSEWYPLFRCCFFSNATVSSKYARPNSATFYFPSQNGKNFVTDLLAIRAELYKFEMVTKTDQQDRGRVKWLSKTKKYRISFALLNRLDSVRERIQRANSNPQISRAAPFTSLLALTSLQNGSTRPRSCAMTIKNGIVSLFHYETLASSLLYLH